LPVKEKQLYKKNRWFTYFVFSANDKILANKRTGKDIWQNLHEFYLIETSQKNTWDINKVGFYLLTQFGITDFLIGSISPFYSQQLTHQIIRGQFIKVKLHQIPFSLRSHQWINKKDLSKLAFPQFINQYLRSHFLNKLL
jgi:A/G-specific adenine glycosylase